MSITAEAPKETIEATDKVKISPRVEITADLQKKIDEIAYKYALGEYSDMDDYTINLGRNGRSLGLSYSQFVTELVKSLRQLDERVQIDNKTAVVKLLMNS